MVRSVVIFEDHSLDNFRPIALSVPTYEIRAGMFNLRERVELAGKGLFGDSCPGTLLCREQLAPLHTCEKWQINPQNGPDQPSGVDRFLWLNGRCIPRFSEILELLKAENESSGFVCLDQYGLVAADLSLQESQSLWRSWSQWIEQDKANLSEKAPWTGHQDLSVSQNTSYNISTLGHIWDIVPATSELLNDDINFLSAGHSFSRRPFGIFPAQENCSPFWLQETTLVQASTIPAMQQRYDQVGESIWLGATVNLAQDVAFDTQNGPIILDSDVTVMPHCYLEGPLYVGCGSKIKAGATIYGESSFGIGNRLSGEIGESTFSDFANKQHDGFIGHAVLGSWINLGAMTTNSDLKNNYGNVRVDLGLGTVDTGLRFVGLMMGDHAKTAIGTLFNTGTCVGYASNIFGGVMPPKNVGNFSWGGLPDSPAYDVEKAIETAAIVMSRRGCRLSSDGKSLMRFLA